MAQEALQGKPELTLTPDQAAALAEIMAAIRSKSLKRHLLTGYAGSGKTTLMQEVVRSCLAAGRLVVLTAPTHKAVSVLARKMREAGVQVSCCTIHSLLGLRPFVDGPNLKFRRGKNAAKIFFEVVVIDECSMIDRELMEQIEMHLIKRFVLYVGDPAQLPPVNEKESQSFTTASRSHLGTIVRQAADNPILKVAHAIRESQGKRFTLSWCKKAMAKPIGVYLPASSVDTWMEKAFTSAEFRADNDAFRYLAWTNQRVGEINKKVRAWLYGETVEPFCKGEFALLRAPILSPIDPHHPLADRKIIFHTNDEARVLDIHQDRIEYTFPARKSLDVWSINILGWAVVLEHPDGRAIKTNIVIDKKAYNKALARVKTEAATESKRWQDRHDFLEGIAKLQAVYALTVHCSQGSTFKNVFVDVGDIKRRVPSNLLEAQQMFYVAVTRPSHALMLVNT